MLNGYVNILLICRIARLFIKKIWRLLRDKIFLMIVLLVSITCSCLRGLLVVSFKTYPPPPEEMLPCRVVKLCYCQRDPSLTYLMNLKRFFISSVFQINKTVTVMWLHPGSSSIRSCTPLRLDLGNSHPHGYCSRLDLDLLPVWKLHNFWET